MGFVDGIEPALERARTAAGELEILEVVESAATAHLRYGMHGRSAT